MYWGVRRITQQGSRMENRIPDAGLQNLAFHWANGGRGVCGQQPPEVWEQGITGGTWGHSPLVGEEVKLPVQLAHRDGLGVEHVVVDSLVHATTDGWLPFQ